MREVRTRQSSPVFALISMLQSLTVSSYSLFARKRCMREVRTWLSATQDPGVEYFLNDVSHTEVHAPEKGAHAILHHREKKKSILGRYISTIRRALPSAPLGPRVDYLASEFPRILTDSREFVKDGLRFPE